MLLRRNRPKPVAGERSPSGRAGWQGCEDRAPDGHSLGGGARQVSSHVFGCTSTSSVTAAILWPRASRRPRRLSSSRCTSQAPPLKSAFPALCSQRHGVGRPAVMPLPAGPAAPSASRPGRGLCHVTLVALGCPLSSVGAVSW